MAVTLNIPDDVAAAIKWPRKQLDHQLAVEMAYALYGRGLASMGTARRLAARVVSNFSPLSTIVNPVGAL